MNVKDIAVVKRVAGFRNTNPVCGTCVHARNKDGSWLCERFSYNQSFPVSAYSSCVLYEEAEGARVWLNSMNGQVVSTKD